MRIGFLSRRGIVASFPILWFAEKPSHPFVPLGHYTAIARSGGPGRPSGWRFGALPWTAASTMAGLATVGRRGLSVAALLSLVAWPISPASAQAAVPLVPVERETAVDPFADFIAEAAQRFGIPVTWIRAVMRVESDGNARSLSAKGAMGLMQIMPETWSRLRERYALGGDPYDPRANILAGTAYLREMFDRYGSPGFLAAYNAGPGRYDDYRASGRALPVETRSYLAALLPMIGDGAVGGTLVATPTARSWTMAPLFVVRSEDASVGKPVAVSLFVGPWRAALSAAPNVPSSGPER